MVHTFKFKDLYMILDVESGAIHSVDKAAYDVICEIGKGNDPYKLHYDAAEIQQIISELAELENAGALNADEPSIVQDTERHIIKSLCLHVAHDCNLRCAYCFAGTGEFCGERMMMSPEVGRKALDFLMERSGSRHNLEVDFFGGEPLMNLKVVKELVAYGRELERRFNKHINFTMTTNGVALDEDTIDYLNKEMHNIVISLDGRREVHDALRPTANGRGSYELIVGNAIDLVKKRRQGEYYIRGTFTNRNLDFTKDVQALHQLGFDQISLEPVVLPEDSPYAILDSHIERILNEYETLADYLLNSRKSGRFINFFHFMVDFGNGPCLKKRMSGCGAGVEYAAISPDGEIYPCHQFVGDDKYKMGNVITGEYNEKISREFSSCNIAAKPKCRTCFAKYFCSGGCAANAYKYNGSIFEPHEITCAFERKRAEIAMGIFAKEYEFGC